MSADIFCKNCAFFYVLGPECRRYAPKPKFGFEIPEDVGVFGLTTNWPEVSEDDWCGEFVEAKEE